jgi:hypothetical protein
VVMCNRHAGDKIPAAGRDETGSGTDSG